MSFVKEKSLNPLSILNFSTFFQYQRFVMPISFLFYMHNGLGFSDYIFCQSMYNATCLITKFLFGFVGDIFPKKYIIIFAYLLFLLRVVLWINFSGFAVILVGEILYGMFKAFYKGNVDSYIYEYLQSKKVGNEMISKYGKLSFFNSVGSAVSCFVGVLLYKYFGFKTLLYIELCTQILAVSGLFLLPNICSNIQHKIKPTYYIKSIFKNLQSVLTNCKVNYYVFYSAILSGLTSVFVWNFQPLLKLSSAPIFLYGVVNFVNQMLRALGGLKAKEIVKKISNITLVRIEYAAVILSFLLLLAGYLIKNYIFIFISLLVICCAIFMFVVFSIFTVSKIHYYTYDYNRATTASVNTFVEDFLSVFLLLGFKYLYDKVGFAYSISIFIILVMIILFPRIKKLQKAG